MRYLNEENPFIWVRFTTADSVTITIYKATDDSVVVNAAAMSELSTTGYFKYQFNPSPTELTEYFYIATNGTEEHAGKIILGGYPDSIKNETDKIQTNIIDVKADYKATGFSTHTPADVRTEMDNNSTKLSIINDNIELIKKIENGRWKILNNQMIFYDNDNTTPLLTFDLKDSDGNPTESSPMERMPV